MIESIPTEALVALGLLWFLIENWERTPKPVIPNKVLRKRIKELYARLAKAKDGDVIPFQNEAELAAIQENCKPVNLHYRNLWYWPMGPMSQQQQQANRAAQQQLSVPRYDYSKFDQALSACLGTAGAISGPNQ